MSRTTRVAAMTTSTVFTAAVPAVLAATDAWTPELPSAATARQWISQPVSTGLLTALTIGAGVMLWLLLATAVLTQAYTALARRLRWTPTLRLPGPLQGLTAALLGATAVTTATGAPAGASPAVTSSGDLPAAEPVTATPTQAQTDQRPAVPAPTYTVRRGDSLCKIAERALGDADRWPEIFALNRGTHFTGVGGTLRDPNLIYPGWKLNLPTKPPARHQPRPPTDVAPPATGPDTNTAPHAPVEDPSRPTPPEAAPRPQQPPPPTPTTASAPDNSAGAVPAPPTPGAETARPAATEPRRTTEQASPGVWLPSGSWVDLGLGLAIVAAVALVWAHRQRRYVPRTPSTRPRHDDPTLAPMPRVVGQIRRGLRRAAAGRPDSYEAKNRRPIDPHADQGDVNDEHQAAGTAELDDEDLEHNLASPADVTDDNRLPVVPALNNPLSALWPPAGLGLTGPGAQAAARGFLTAALASGVEHPEARSEVIIPLTTATTLFGAAAALPRTPRLTVTAGLDEALHLLEMQVMHRTRLLHRHEVDTVAELRHADPYEEPLPPLMLLADTTSSHERARVAALLAQGQRLDIHGVLLGDWPDGDTVAVAADGATTPAEGDRARQGNHPADLGRLAVLDAAEAAALLTTLAESHTGLPQPPAPAEPTPAAPAEGAGSPTPGDTIDSPQPPTTHSRATNTTIDDETPPATDTAQPNRPGTTAHGRRTSPEQAADDAEDGKPPWVRVRVLGTPGVIDGDPQRRPRAKSLELLVYLAVHDGAAPAEAILDDLLPDAPSRKAPGRLYTYVSGLRAVLHHAAGHGGHVTHPDHRYLLNRDLLDVDLWRMRAAIRDAAQTADPQTRVAALRRAVDAYTGPLAEGCDYEWVEPYRQAIRQEALDASLALADALTGQPAQQLRVLDDAITHHPHHEALYQAAMRARAELGDAGGIRALRRALTRRLSEIDAEPSDDTLTLADRLITDLSHHRRTAGSHHPANREGAAK